MPTTKIYSWVTSVLFILLFTLTNAQVIIKDTILITPRAKAFLTLTTPAIPGGYNASYHITTTEIQDAHVTKVILHTAQLDTTPVLYGGVGTNNISLGRVESPGEITIEAYTFEDVAMTVSIGEGDPYTCYVSFNGKPGGRILLSERVPVPTVRINTPRNQIFTLSKEYQPAIVPAISYSPTSGEFAAEVTVSPQQINTAEYYAQLNTTDFIRIFITASASNERGTATDTASFFLTRDKTPETFRVTITPDHLRYGDSASVTAIALDEDGEEINMPQEWWVSVAYDPWHNYGTEDEYYLEAGSFTSPTQEPGAAIFVPYSEVKNGEVKFIADGEMKIGATPVEIRMAYADRVGAGSVAVTDILDHFTVALSADTMEHNATTDIARVIAQDSDSNQLNLYWATAIKVAAAPSGFGRLTKVIATIVRPAKPDIDSLLRAKTAQLLESKEKVNPLQRAYLQSLVNDTTLQQKKFSAAVRKKHPEQQPAARNSVSVKAEVENVSDEEEPEPEPTEFITEYSSGEWMGISYVADGTMPDSNTTITLTATAVDKPGATGKKGVVIKGESTLDHFEVTFDKDTVAFTEESKIFVQAKDKDDKDIELDASSLLRLSVTTNDSSGTFIDKNNDTLKTTPVQLKDIPYGDAKEGLIRFAAVKKNPESVALCNVQVKLQEDTMKMGEKEIPVVEQTLRIVMGTPRRVRPSIPTEDRDTNMTRLRKKSFEVKMTRNKKAVSNHPFLLFTNYVDSSGGHAHDGTRDVRRLDIDDNYGYFTIGAAPAHHRPLNEVTNADGEFEARYNASIFGDSIRIYLKSRDPQKAKFFQDSVTIVEKVDSLHQLNNGMSYGLVGGTYAHHSPPGFQDNENHWATDSTISRLQRIAEAWHQRYPQELILQINDISLRFGGKFDIGGRGFRGGEWQGPHELHRLGKSVDVRTDLYYYDRFGQLHHRVGIPVRSPRTEPFNMQGNERQMNPNSRIIRHPIFEQRCVDNHGVADLHGRNTINEHYHIDFDN